MTNPVTELTRDITQVLTLFDFDPEELQSIEEFFNGIVKTKLDKDQEIIKWD